jgi:hypothetical protein
VSNTVANARTGCSGWSASEAGLRSDAGATDGVREATQRHASESPSSGEGEGGRLFDEIGNLVEPTERPGASENNDPAHRRILAAAL